MKYSNILTLSLYSNKLCHVKINHNTSSEIIAVDSLVTYSITLAPDADHHINIEHAVPDQAFFYVQGMRLGRINITELAHHNDTCRVLDRATGNKIANFVQDIGPPDQFQLTIDQEFYKKIFAHSQLIKV